MFEFLLDIIFPKKLLVQELERMDASEFASRATRGASNFGGANDSAKGGLERTGRNASANSGLGRAGKEILSCFDYRDRLVRQAVFELKYRGNKKVARLLATTLYDELLAFLEEYAPLTNFTEPLLVPIPLSKTRESERGFNQCKLLVDILLEMDGGRNFTLSFALTKCKDTGSQTKMDTRKKRLENLKGCFVADGKAVEGRNIILIDDVATTGATLVEARKTLLRAGARKVIAFTVAH
ncbi:MAG TPA: hypothetical protein DEF00_03525 [Candidatus Taylorbacteria bacterium]|nr:MAG: Phosphoribosyl transferase domain protein [Parcubacteria group bacterium GW2011_GWC2_48_17]HBV01434.1 hypothetical protein [Candidatus Taylorbacteria bacterium]